MGWTVIILFSLLCVYVGYCEDIKVDLKSYQPGNKNVYKQHTTLSEDETKVKVENINDDIGFFIIQVHSFIENVSLSYNTSVRGTNVGLVYAGEGSSAVFHISRYAKVDRDAPILLIITVYDYLDPVPGGCNLSFETKRAPYQVISYNDDYIKVLSQPPSVFGVSCDEDKVKVDMYHLFLREHDSNIQTYFDGIEKMITVEDIKLNGRKLRPGDGYYKYRRLYSSYKGTGEVFAMIATFNNRSSAYVSAITYGCDLTNWHGCLTPVTDYWKFICAALLIFGLISCFVGHKFFRFTLFLTGFTFGVLVTYLAVSFDGHFGIDEKIVTSVITGFFYGVIWVFIWWKYGIPVLSVHLNLILSGFLIASIIFYAGVADIHIFSNDINFWLTFSSLILIYVIIWIPATMHGHIFGCSFLGAYACVVALNCYLGGNMHYIIINTLRRATIKDFNLAVIDPPFQLSDILHVVLWAFLIVVGCFLQIRDQRGKPPFPPNGNIVLAARESERTPLIRPENVSVPQYV